SPEAYSVARSLDWRRAATCSSRVDLPMPGSPPMRIIEPGTIPPPRTKSNSSIPVFHRRASLPLTSRSLGVTATLPPSASVRVPPARRLAPLVGALRAATSSTSEFHAPQTSHRPAHLGCSAPHSVQRYTVLALGLMRGRDA